MSSLIVLLNYSLPSQQVRVFHHYNLHWGSFFSSVSIIFLPISHLSLPFIFVFLFLLLTLFIFSFWSRHCILVVIVIFSRWDVKPLQICVDLDLLHLGLQNIVVVLVIGLRLSGWSWSLLFLRSLLFLLAFDWSLLFFFYLSLSALIVLSTKV